MVHEIEGVLIEKMEQQQITERMTKREFVIEVLGQYPQFIKFEAINAYCDLIDVYEIGEKLKISFDVKGRKSVKDGKTSYFNSLNAWKFERIGGETKAKEQAPPTAPVQQPAATTESKKGPDDDLPF